MVNPRKKDVSRRNVTLHRETYEKLDKFLLQIIQERGDTNISRNDAIELLLEEHNKGQEKKSNKG